MERRLDTAASEVSRGHGQSAGLQGGATSAGGCSSTNMNAEALTTLKKLPFKIAESGTSGSSKNQQTSLPDLG